MSGRVVKMSEVKLQNPRFIMECLYNNERGDGVLFATLHRDRFVFNKSKSDRHGWMVFTGHSWQHDRMDQARAAVEDVALAYQAQLDNLRAESAETADKELRGKMELQIKELHRRVQRLRTVKGVDACLRMAHCFGPSALGVYGDEFDQHPMLLPCANGVIDLATGRLHDGRPGDYLVRTVPVEYLGIDRRNEDWEQFIDQICIDDQDKVGFKRRLFGYCLTGLRREHFIACFVGDGRNGKGTMFEVMAQVLGDLYWSIDADMLLEQKFGRNSASHSADIVSLQGRRLVRADETDPGKRISAAQVKRLTGGDTLKGRSPHDVHEINFQPTHKLVLVTNDTPAGLTKDFALFERLIYLQYPLRFVDDPDAKGLEDPMHAHLYRKKDPSLQERLLRNKPGILSWLVRGCMEWQINGLAPPISIRAAADELRRNEDILGQFIDQACTVGEEKKTTFKSFYDDFTKWYEDNIAVKDKYIPSKKSVTKQLTNKGFTLPNPRSTSGNLYINGLDSHYFRET